MKRCYIFKDGMQQASTATRESALDLIRQYQKLETHPILREEFGILSRGSQRYILMLLQVLTVGTARRKSECWYLQVSSFLSPSVTYFINQCLYVILIIYAHLFGNALKCLLGFTNCLCRSVINDDLAAWLLEEKYFVARFQTEQAATEEVNKFQKISSCAVGCSKKHPAQLSMPDVEGREKNDGLKPDRLEFHTFFQKYIEN